MISSQKLFKKINPAPKVWGFYLPKKNYLAAGLPSIYEVPALCCCGYHLDSPRGASIITKIKNTIDMKTTVATRTGGLRAHQLKLTFVNDLNFYKLKFYPGSYRDPKLKRDRMSFSCAEFKGVSGIIVVREKSTGRLVRVNGTDNDLYLNIFKVISRRNGHKSDFEFALIPVEKKLIPAAKQRIYETYMEYAFTDTFLKVKKYMDNGENVPRKILRFFEAFQTDMFGRKVRTLNGFYERYGIYLIQRGRKIDYIGRASNLSVRAYAHFMPSAQNIPGQVSYFEELDKHRFCLAFIEIPRRFVYKGEEFVLSKEEIYSMCKEWEEKFIAQFNPRRNTYGKSRTENSTELGSLGFSQHEMCDEPAPF